MAAMLLFLVIVAAVAAIVIGHFNNITMPATSIFPSETESVRDES